MHPHDERRKEILTAARDELQRTWDRLATKSQDLINEIEDTLNPRPEDEGLLVAYNTQIASLNDAINQLEKALHS